MKETGPPWTDEFGVWIRREEEILRRSSGSEIHSWAAEQLKLCSSWCREGRRCREGEGGGRPEAAAGGGRSIRQIRGARSWMVFNVYRIKMIKQRLCWTS